MDNRSEIRLPARQGDVLLLPMPDSAWNPGKNKVNTGKSLTVALGEVTGHHHTIYADTAVIESYETGDVVAQAEKIVRMSVGTEIRHQEHATIPVPPGVWRTVTPREYVAPEVSRRVLD